MKTLSAWSIILSLILFFGSVSAGYRYANSDAALALSENLSSSLSPLRELGAFPLLFFIFFNNAIKALLVIILGIVPFVFSGSFILLNGFILGVVVNHAIEARGLEFTLLGLLPHGVLELSAILVSSALGFQIGRAFIASLQGKKSNVERQFKGSLVLYLKFILPALFVAALVETVVGKYVLPGAN